MARGKELAKSISEERRRLRREMRERTFTYLVAAFSLVAGLAWNEAVRSFIDYVLPPSTNTLIAKFSYAIVITIIVVIITVSLERIFKREEKGDSKNK